MSKRLHTLAVYLLLALLPLQAVAASRLTLCAATADTVQSMPEHCSMQGMATSKHKPMHDSGSGCWLGSICLVSIGAAALPTSMPAMPVLLATPTQLFISQHYDSVIADGPQRPPNTLC